MNKYRAIIVQEDKLFGDCHYYAECVQAENEQDALEKAKQTETFRRDDTSVVVSIEELKVDGVLIPVMGADCYREHRGT